MKAGVETELGCWKRVGWWERQRESERRQGEAPGSRAT